MPLHADGPHSHGSATAAGQLARRPQRFTSCSYQIADAPPSRGRRVRPFRGVVDELATIFEALHEMNHSVQALRGARIFLSTGQRRDRRRARAAEHFTALGDEIERLGYGLNVLHCPAVDILDEDSAGPARSRPTLSAPTPPRPASAASSVGDRGRPRALRPAPAPRTCRSTAPHGVRHLAPELSLHAGAELDDWRGPARRWALACLRLVASASVAKITRSCWTTGACLSSRWVDARFRIGKAGARAALPLADSVSHLRAASRRWPTSSARAARRARTAERISSGSIPCR
jgi:hypothetical protein